MFPSLSRLLSPTPHAEHKISAHRRLALEILEARQMLSLWSVAENGAYFGNLNQHDLEYSYPQFGLADNNIACGPCAATNSLVYLQNAFPSLFGHSLIASAGQSMQGGSTHTTYDDWIYTAGGILAGSQLMNTTLADGTYHDNFIMGLYNYTNTLEPDKLKYKAQDVWSPASWGNVPAGPEPPRWVESGSPTWRFAYDALEKSAAVVAQIHYVLGGGHFMSVEGMTWDDSLDTGTFTFMDTWVGSATTVNAYLSSGAIYLDYGGPGTAWIGMVDVLALKPPTAPTGLTATVSGVRSIDLRWDAVPSATSYTLERANSADGNFYPIHTGTETHFTDHIGTLSPTADYYYRVRANNVSADSPYSPVVSLIGVFSMQQPPANISFMTPPNNSFGPSPYAGDTPVVRSSLASLPQSLGNPQPLYYSILAGTSNRLVVSSILDVPLSGQVLDQQPSKNGVFPDSLLPTNTELDNDRSNTATMPSNAIPHSKESLHSDSSAAIDRIMMLLEKAAENNSPASNPAGETYLQDLLPNAGKVRIETVPDNADHHKRP